MSSGISEVFSDGTGGIRC